MGGTRNDHRRPGKHHQPEDDTDRTEEDVAKTRTEATRHRAPHDAPAQDRTDEGDDGDGDPGPRRNLPAQAADQRGSGSFEQAERHPTEHGADEVADAAEDRSRERLDPGEESGEKEDLAEQHCPQGSGDAGHGTPDGERRDDHAVDVDPHQAGDLLVLRHRPDRPSRLGTIDEEPEADHRHDGGDDHEQLDALDVEPEYRDPLLQALGEQRERQERLADETTDGVLDEERHPDRGDQRDEAGGAAHRAIGDALDHHRHQTRRQHRGQQHDAEGEGKSRLPHPGIEEGVGDEVAGHRSGHEYFTVGEVDEAEYAIDHRVTEGDESVHETLCEAAHHDVAPCSRSQPFTCDLKRDGAHNRPGRHEPQKHLEGEEKEVDRECRSVERQDAP